MHKIPVSDEKKPYLPKLFVPINEYQLNAVNTFTDLLKLKNYSQNTIRNYRSWLIFFITHFPDKKPSTISHEEITSFLLHFRSSTSWSATSQNQLISAIKFFYEQVLRRQNQEYALLRAQKNTNLPTVFDELEIIAMIKATDNLKHKTILCLAYAGGLRVSEITNLKISCPKIGLH